MSSSVSTLPVFFAIFLVKFLFASDNILLKDRLIIVKNILSDCFWNVAGKCSSSFCGFLHYAFLSIFTHWKSYYCPWQGRIIIWVHTFATNTKRLKLFEAWKQNWYKCMAGVLILIIICGSLCVTSVCAIQYNKIFRYQVKVLVLLRNLEKNVN